MVTFHHFTTPRWVAHHGGWEEPDTVDRFARFCERTTKHLGDLIGRACTINEPNMVATGGYLAGSFPPGRRDPALRRAVNDIFCQAHRAAVDAIKGVRSDLDVGITVAMQSPHPVDGGEERAARIMRNLEDVYLEAATGDDFLGVQTYTRMRWGADGFLGPEPGVPVVIMGYEFWPEALEGTIRYAASQAGVPIHVTENGIGTDDDAQRSEYVRRALAGVGRCLADGIDVRSYFYWSLLDNFEWLYGYGPRFGIVDVDRASQRRTVKPSGQWLGRIARAGVLAD